MGKRAVLLVLLLGAAAADVLFFRSAAVVAAAKAETSPDARIAILESDKVLSSFDDEWNRLLGKARFEAGADRLGQAAIRDENFRDAKAELLLSLDLNPLSPAAHFDLAQAVEYFRMTGIAISADSSEEYLRAARLAGGDPVVLETAARMLFSRWPSLNEEARLRTGEILRTILAGADDEKSARIFSVWELNVGDYAVLKSVLPPDPSAYRRLARFLAERSLDRAERIRALAQAEAFEVARARAAVAEGQNEFQAFKLKNAEDRFVQGLAIIDSIKFYQNLDGTPTIDPAEVQSLRRSLLLGKLQCRLETAGSLGVVLPDVLEYLRIDDGAGAAGELERMLRGRDLIDARLDAAGKDLARLSVEMKLAFRQNRFRDVTAAGQALERGVVMVPEADKPDYAAVLEIVGDAFQKLDFLYESNTYFQKARSVGGDKPDVLLKMKRNYERLNDADGMRAAADALDKTLTEHDVDWSGKIAVKGAAFIQNLVLAGEEVRLTLKISPDPSLLRPYAGVFFNGRVVWEDFVAGENIVLTIKPVPGSNRLEIIPWNGPLALSGLSIVSASEAAVPPGKIEAPPRKRGSGASARRP